MSVKKTKTLSPYQKIVRAGRAGKGVMLSSGDVWRLVRDEAIVARADLDDEEDKGAEPT